MAIFLNMWILPIGQVVSGSIEKIGTKLFSELFVVSTVGQKPNTANTQTTTQLLSLKSRLSDVFDYSR